jgi:hypothetical protein
VVCDEAEQVDGASTSESWADDDDGQSRHGGVPIENGRWAV